MTFIGIPRDCPSCGDTYMLQIEITEANQAKPELGTTGCSDAGGGDTPCKPGRSADWQARLSVIAYHLKSAMHALEDGPLDDDLRLQEMHTAIRCEYEDLTGITEVAAAK